MRDRTNESITGKIGSGKAMSGKAPDLNCVSIVISAKPEEDPFWGDQAESMLKAFGRLEEGKK